MDVNHSTRSEESIIMIWLRGKISRFHVSVSGARCNELFQLQPFLAFSEASQVAADENIPNWAAKKLWCLFIWITVILGESYESDVNYDLRNLKNSICQFVNMCNFQLL